MGFKLDERSDLETTEVCFDDLAHNFFERALTLRYLRTIKMIKDFIFLAHGGCYMKKEYSEIFCIYSEELAALFDAK